MRRRIHFIHLCICAFAIRLPPSALHVILPPIPCDTLCNPYVQQTVYTGMRIHKTAVVAKIVLLINCQ